MVGVSRAAVDGGQSGLRLRLLPEGREGRGPGYAHSADGVKATIESVRQAAQAAGLGTVDTVCLGLSGYPAQDGGVAALAAGVAEVLGAGTVLVAEDMVTAHAGALPGGYGVVVAAGTGTVCLAVDGDGRFRKIDGGGYLFGDAGSGFAIGRAGLAAVQRAEDGRGAATSLTRAARDSGHGDRVGLYTSPTLVEDVARFARTVLTCAQDGDPVAREIVEGAAADLAETAAAAVAWLPGTGSVPVACVGGVFNAGELLLDPIRRLLPARAELVTAAGAPLDGAARLATRPLGPYTDLVTVWNAER